MKQKTIATRHLRTRADGYVATRLMCRLICNLPELSIRIFNPITSYFLIYRYVFRIADPYIPCRQICSNKTNVPADLHVLLSTAKNLPEYNIRIFNPLASYC